MIAFLIDADNFSSATWIQEALELLEHAEGAVAIRRAYGSAENLKGLAETMRSLAIRPFVNMSLTKNSTDMSLAVDAMELACLVPRPSIVVIGSGDSDFVPLVVRLRERGIKVFCATLESKLSQEAVPAYDRIFYVGKKSVPRAKPARTKTVQAVATEAPVAPVKIQIANPEPIPQKSAGPKKVAAKALPTKPLPVKPAQKAIASKPSVKGGTAKKEVPITTAVVAPTVQQILGAIPKLKTGDWLRFNDIASVLHEKKLLAKNATSPKLFKKFPGEFELSPADKPQKVRWIPSGR